VRSIIDLRQLGDPEVEDLRASVTHNEDVFRLEIPVDDPLLVRRRQPAGHLRTDLRRMDRTDFGTVQGRALEQLTHEKRDPVFDPDVEDCHDVWVIELARRARFLLEDVGRRAARRWQASTV